jgi:bifunctional DNA-binding transcriptional regulator/antitoxin component of YhaV-PrlF toxin-antitoxin module
MAKTEYTVDVRERGEITIPKELREKYHLTKRTEVKLVPKVEGILIKPKAKDPVGHLKGLAKDVWPDDVSSVDLVKDLRRRADFEAKESL